MSRTVDPYQTGSRPVYPELVHTVGFSLWSRIKSRGTLFVLSSPTTLNPRRQSLRVDGPWVETILFVIGGGDTISTAIDATLFYVV
ncbi:hypothetical protein F5Y13DRAFT_162157 [Hypoxylon sp. FL1857]|nr:hypothetical protein F5Y13DRAFT_162157 [Hypoxylon sp. FL1857]